MQKNLTLVCLFKISPSEHVWYSDCFPRIGLTVEEVVKVDPGGSGTDLTGSLISICHESEGVSYVDALFVVLEVSHGVTIGLKHAVLEELYSGVSTH